MFYHNLAHAVFMFSKILLTIHDSDIIQGSCHLLATSTGIEMEHKTTQEVCIHS
jgi:hypothetical protein